MFKSLTFKVMEIVSRRSMRIATEARSSFRSTVLGIKDKEIEDDTSRNEL